MDAKALFHFYHEQIVVTWFNSLHGDPSTRYHFEQPDDLRSRINIAALAFRRAILYDDSTDLKEFITQIAQRRFSEGFKVSEVQRSFELYRQTLIPLLLSQIDAVCLEPVMMKLHDYMVFAITQFSEYFQRIHEEFLCNHAQILEREIELRTRELVESREKYKTLVEDINEGFFVLVDGLIVFANRAFAHMHGYGQEEVLRRNYLDFVAEEHREMLRKVYSLSLSNGPAPSRIEFFRIHKDGRKLPTEIMAKRSLFECQAANIGIYRDISERVALDKRTREAEKLKALAQQAASLAHEVRNPLSAVRMNLQLFAQAEGNPEHLRLLQASLSEVDQIERRLQEMMDISFPLRLSFEPVDLGELLTRCLNCMQQRLTVNRVKTFLRVSHDVTSITADASRLEQAFVNLLFNAVEAQPSGGRVAISVRPAHKDNREWVEILISDLGSGIAKEMLPYLFDPMFSQKARGTGLGLHNVHRIIEAHGGLVHVEQNRPQGMRFKIRLPWR